MIWCWGILGVWGVVMVLYGINVAWAAERPAEKWTKKYTPGELVAMVVCWPLTLLMTVAASLPSIADKIEKARDEGEE